uniref:Uncharacterized protein n=1 Tax=Cacopsylla melanoneura TaxID=428564 RepID=A0A8D8UCL1_9HEMI
MLGPELDQCIWQGGLVYPECLDCSEYLVSSDTADRNPLVQSPDYRQCSLFSETNEENPTQDRLNCSECTDSHCLVYTESLDYPDCLISSKNPLQVPWTVPSV